MNNKTKKDTIIELLKSDLSDDLIALKTDSSVNYVKSVEKGMKSGKSNSEKTIKKLRIKAESGTFDKVRMPSISSIAEMLTEMGIEHTYDNSTNVVEYRSAGHTYVNSRHNGKEGKKLIIEPSKEDAEKSGIHYLELDSSDSYYSWNTHGYARQIVQLLTSLGKI